MQSFHQIQITRFKECVDCTISRVVLVSAEGKTLMKCYGLEPLHEGTTPNQNLRIPAGKYGLMWHVSKRFHKKLPLLHNIDVPKERDILIHAGNYPSDSVGCILVGEHMKIYGENKGLIEKSNLALQRLLSILIRYSNKELDNWIAVLKNEFEALDGAMEGGE